MFTRPTTEQVLDVIANELRETVLAELEPGPARVMVEQVEQLMRGCAQRSAHEIAWIHEEVAAIEVVVGRDLGSPLSLHLDDVAAWYDTASHELSAAIDVAFSNGDHDRVDELRTLLDARSGHEMQIIGALDLVGRG